MRMPNIIVLAAFIAGLAGCAPQPQVHETLRFECLWWSPQQIATLDPNRPPPKTTRVTISRWEYSDPIGVPHPATVDVVLHVDRPLGRAPQLAVSWLGTVPKREIRVMERRRDGYVAMLLLSDDAVQGYSRIVVSTLVGGRTLTAVLPIIVGD